MKSLVYDIDQSVLMYYVYEGHHSAEQKNQK